MNNLGVIQDIDMDKLIGNEVKQAFFEQTGIRAKTVSQISFFEWMIEGENGETYMLKAS